MLALRVDPVQAHRPLAVDPGRPLEHGRHHQLERDLRLPLAQQLERRRPPGPTFGCCALRRLVDGRLGERPVEGLPDDHGQHGAVRERADRGLERRDVVGGEQDRDLLGRSLGARLRRVEVDARPEVLPVRRVRRSCRPAARPSGSRAGRAGSSRSTAEPVTPLPFRTVIVVSRGGGAFRRGFGFSPSATAVAFLGDSTSGLRELLHGLPDVLARGRGGRSRRLLQPLDLRLEEVAGRERVGEERVAQHGLPVELRRCRPDADLDVLRDRLDHLRQLERRRASP